MKTLVALPSGLEGTIRCLPALEALAVTGRQLFALSEPETAALLRLSPAALLPRLGELAATRTVVAATRCEEAVVLSGRLDDAWLTHTAGVPWRWGYRSLVSGWFLNRRVRRPSRRQRAARPASEDFRELLGAMDVAWLTSEPRLAFDDEHRSAARERLGRAHVKAGEGPLVGIHPGIRGGGADRPWPRRRFEELARQLRRRHPRLQFIVLATTEDLWPAVRIHEETGKVHPVIGPDLAPDALAALLAELDVVVAVESAMLDLAAAAGTTTLGLYLRRPGRWAPPGKGHRRIHAGKAGTIAAIELDRVVEAFAELESSGFQ